MMRKSFSLLLMCIFTTNLFSQNITNPDLNGTGALPTSWQKVPTGDPASMSSNNGITDSPDLTDINGPNKPVGLFGFPYSGTTFVSCLRGKFPGAPYTPPNAEFHEGIQQVVNGFTPGQTYTVNFYQCVVKQDRYLDRSGAWSVYFDNTLAGISAVSYSSLAYNDSNFIWSPRSVNFTATSAAHTIKFLATDDDANIMVSLTDTTGALRMGIDSIWITTCNFSVNLGPNTSLCPPNTSLNLNATTANATYQWQDNSSNPTYNVSSSGTYWVTVTANGCSVTDSIQITIGANTSSSQNPSICSGNSYTLPGGAVVTSPGIYTDTIPNVSGCDSIITTNLSVNTTITTNQNPIICTGSSYTLPGGNIVTTAGVYYDTLNSYAGCDSVITTNLTVTPNVTNVQSPTICIGSSFTLPGGTVVTSSGIYIDTLSSYTGCDSIITTTLSVVNNVTSTQSPVICTGSTFTLPGGNVVTAAGTYSDTLSSYTGCDSIITTTLTVNATLTNAVNPIICMGNSYTLPGGTVVANSGTYVDTLLSSSGCDSIITTTLIVNSTTASVSPNVSIQSGGSTTLIASGGGTYFWSPSIGLSATTGNSVIASPSQTTTYCVVVTKNGCLDSICVTVNVETPCTNSFTGEVPNAFSPNNDGLNEEFCLKGWNECLKSFVVIIVDRWGEKVFESKDPNFCWDGRYRGITMDAQVFVYYIKATFNNLDEPIIKKGNISLVK